MSAFASKKQSLWSAGFSKATPLRAGTRAVIYKDSIDIGSIKLSNEAQKTIDNMDEAVQLYSSLLVKAINKRLVNLNRVGVLLSGGVDSGLLAWLVSKAAKKQGIEVIAYSAGMIDAEDLLYSRQLAEELGVKHRVKILSEDDIRRYIKSVLKAVEERDIVQVEAGVGVYSALELAANDGIRSIFSGQGPDELWGGYTWYPNVLEAEGYNGLMDKMDSDLQRGDIETFDRENKIAMDYGAEQLFPYVDNEITELASMVSPRLKVKSPDDKLGKHPHRQAAKLLGLPDKYAKRAKNAAQHGTGVHGFLDNIAQEAGFSPELVEKIGYNSTDISKEQLASSTRYGYKFDDADLWAVPQHIQLYLDTLAYENSLLNYSEREKIKNIIKKSKLS
jgi:asparagine synthase (glutamine-hydrolysing)